MTATAALDELRGQILAATTDAELRALLVRMKALVGTARAARWEPYPWQHPHHHPPGWESTRAPGVCDDRCVTLPPATIPTQAAWLELGGRGTGKTEGASHYVDAHAQGPACDHRVPGGHRMTIIAPTQTDAFASCMSGPSGIQTLNPDVKVTTTKEGTTARWPNGTVARLLGAHGPDDLERLRAWSNVCVAAGTLIRTEHGETPVEDVAVGDRVWTRTGLRKVVAAHATGHRPVVLVSTGDTAVWVTPDHPLARPDGTFTEARTGGKVLVWQEHRSSTEDAPTGNGPTATTAGNSASFTGSCTPPRSALSPTGITSTTGPATARTPSTPQASSLWTPPRTPTSTKPVATPHGTPQGVERPSRAALSAEGSASGAEPLSRPTRTSHPDSADHGAATWARRHEHLPTACAACAGNGSPPPAGRPPAPVARDAEVSPPTPPVPVYDLTVEGHHEFYADDVLVGNCLVWVEEAGAMRRLEDVLDLIPFSMRLGSRPHRVITTTPRNRQAIIDLIADPANVQTKGRTRDATRLNPAVRASYETLFAGTTLGRQELDAELIDDVEGAMWVDTRHPFVDGLPNPDERPGISNDRVPVETVGWTSHRPDAPIILAPTMMGRTIVAVDPPGGRTEAGIVVVGALGQHAYPLADLSTAGPPDTWARLALNAYLDYGAEGIAAEHTYGGDMVTSVLTTAATVMGIPCPPIFRVPTKVGKRLRAEPVVALYQQHRVHHVGHLPGVEGEQRTWIEGEGESPNRLDALVHGITYLLIRASVGTVSNPARQARIPGR